MIHPTAEISPDAKIGDHCEIGPGVRIEGEFSCGDYCKIHRDTWISGVVSMGHVVWIGQGCILDGRGGLQIEDFVGIGAGSQIWTHIAHGDVLQGCLLDSAGGAILGENAWLVGHCLMGPHIIGEKVVALLGSVITKDIAPHRVVGGAPADYVRVAGWKHVSDDEKRAGFAGLVAEYPVGFCTLDPSAYDPVARTYVETNSPEEVAFNKWLFKKRAKFRPAE